MDGGAKSCSVGSSGSCAPRRCASPTTGDVVLEGGRGISRAGIGDAEVARDAGMGEAVAERGKGTDSAGIGEVGRDTAYWTEWALCGVECEVDEEGEGEFVRVRLGVRVLRDRGRRKETFRSLSNCEGL